MTIVLTGKNMIREHQYMQGTKIQFSQDELKLMADSSWILTKNAVIKKIVEGMGNLVERMKETVALHASLLPYEITHSNAKISRGENYEGLPYIMMDYPKVFGKDDILAIRTFFWWGNYATISLHIKGIYTTHLLKPLATAGAVLIENSFYYSHTGDEWNHDITSDSYTPVPELMSADFLRSLQYSPFIKFSAKVGLDQWSEMEERLYALFLVLIAACGEKATSS